MDRVIKKLPIPIVGLMLALGALGNLIGSYGKTYRNIFGCISGLIFILVVIKIFKETEGVKKALNNPVVMTVFPTFSMGAMILSTYVKAYFPSVGHSMWVLAIILHIGLIVYVTKKYIFNFNIKKIFPSYFVVYVGIVVGSVTAPLYNAFNIGEILFWFGFISYLILLPIIVYRVIKVKEIPKPALPTITIFAAPASLCLAGYLSTFKDINLAIVYFLTFLSLTMLSIVLIYMPKMLKLKFYPSYSAFTFPIVISAIAIKKTNGFLIGINKEISLLKTIVKFEELLAIGFVLYVLFKYISFLLESKRIESVKKV
ncbi:MAG: TDT family transporter [Firmicutes bacterium]|nr:TDT family transporter [Bacillota bacterium]